MNKSKIYSVTLGSIFSLAIMSPNIAQADSNPYIGEIMAVGYNFCPRGWADADGQLLAINSNTALFSLFGTMYGGDGRTSFALPDLRGRVPVSQGTGPGLSSLSQGQRGGSESFTMTVNNLPAHSHGVQATNDFANKPGPGNKLLAADNTGLNKYTTVDGSTSFKTMSSTMITNTGGGQTIVKRSPYLAMRWCVSLVGVFPSRD
ncbi:phage tail protein [Amphritea japonica]|nr:tail fiber protein [Amphritea japonica]